MKALITVLTLLTAWMATSTLQAADVMLYIRPDDKGEPVRALPEDSKLLRSARPVLDTALSESGWKWVETPAALTGYVAEAYVHPDLTLQSGAPVRLAPGSDGHVFTFISSTDKTEVLESGEWAVVRIEKSLPLYFNQPPPEATAPVEPLPLAESKPEMLAEVAPEKDSTTQPSAHTTPLLESDIDSLSTPGFQTQIVGEVGMRDIEPLPLAPIEASAEKMMSEPTVPELEPQPPVSEAPEAPIAKQEPVAPPVRKSKPAPEAKPAPPPARAIPITSPPPAPPRVYEGAVTQQIFEGILQRARGGLFRSAPYPFELIGLDGGRIAYLDTSNMLVHGSLSRYLGRRVIVVGTSEVGDGKAPLVIHARTLRQ